MKHILAAAALCGLLAGPAMAQSPAPSVVLQLPSIPEACYGKDGCNACLKLQKSNAGVVFIGQCDMPSSGTIWSAPGTGTITTQPGLCPTPYCTLENN